jgi:hypothetical protein
MSSVFFLRLRTNLERLITPPDKSNKRRAMPQSSEDVHVYMEKLPPSPKSLRTPFTRPMGPNRTSVVFFSKDYNCLV